MCGIVGYIGTQQAAPILLDGLSKLEYRGYDSAGIAIYNGTSIDMVKSKGRLKVLNELTHDGETIKGTIGIGHTRWATHGSPSDVNAHPHFASDNSTEYQKRATDPENPVFSGFSLYSENLSDTLKTHENVPVTNR